MRRAGWITTLAATVGAAIFLAPIVGAASWPEWAEEALASDYVERYATEDAVLVLDEWEIKLAGGQRRGVRRWLVHVLTDDGVDAAVLPLHIGAFSRYDRVRMWVRQSDGRTQRYNKEDGTLLAAAKSRELDETQFLLLAPPGRRAGTLMAVEARFVLEADYPQDKFTIQQRMPVVRSSISIDARGGWQVDATMYLGDNPGPDRVEDEAVWRFSHVPAIRRNADDFAPAPPRMALALNYSEPGKPSPFADWSSTARWVAELFRTPGQETPRVERLHASLAPGATDFVDSAGRQARALRYFSILLGWGGLKPRSPETTLRREFGDCKDKAQVLIALLEHAGIESHPVLIRAPTDAYIPDEMPSPFHFDHVVVGIPWTGRELAPGMTLVESADHGTLRLFDATLPAGSAQDMSPRYEGAAALVVHPSTSGLIRLPGSGAEENRVEIDQVWVLTGDDRLEVSRSERLYGVPRMKLEGDAGEWATAEELRERLFARITETGDLPESLDVTDVSAFDDGSWGYDATYSSVETLGSFGSVRMLDLGRLGSSRMIPVPDSADEPESRYLPFLGSYRETIRLRHAGRDLVGTAADIDVRNSLGHVRLTTTRDGAEVIVERELFLGAREIPPAKRAEAEDLRRALSTANGAALIFR